MRLRSAASLPVYFPFPFPSLPLPFQLSLPPAWLTFLQDFRTRLDLLAGHYLFLRGDNRRELETSDCSLLEMGDEGASPCFGIVMQVDRSKTNQGGKKEVKGALRHKDPLLCTMGALAQYLFWRFEVAGESPPDFRTRASWYKNKLLQGKVADEALSYDAQRETTWRILAAAEATGSKVTHMMRIKGTQDGERRGGEKPEVCPI